MTQQINLLHAVAVKRAFRPTSATAMVYGVLGAAALTCAIAAYEHSRLPALKSEARTVERAFKEAQLALGKATAEREARKTEPADEAKLAQLEAQLRSRREVADALDGGVVGTSAGFSRYMMALSRQSLAGVWLTGFDIAAGGSELSLSGRALSADLVPTYLQRLTQEPPLRGRRFASILISQPGATAPARSERKDDGGDPPGRKAAPYVEFVISSGKTEEGYGKIAPPPPALPESAK